MFDILLKVIALGIASAFSPVILAVSISLLTIKENPRQKLIFFLLGGVLAVLLLAILGYAIWDDDINLASKSSNETQVNIIFGALLILFGIKELISATKDKKPKIHSYGLGLLFTIGFLANITNFDAVLLNLAAIHVIFSADFSFIVEFLLVLLAAFFFLSPSLVPLLIYLLKPEKMQSILNPVGKFMQKYGRYLVAVVFLVAGIYLIFLS